MDIVLETEEETFKNLIDLPPGEAKEAYEWLGPILPVFLGLENYLGHNLGELLNGNDEFNSALFAFIQKFFKFSKSIRALGAGLRLLCEGFSPLPLNAEEKKSVDSLMEVWGDDHDQVYADLNRNHLKKQLDAIRL